MSSQLLLPGRDILVIPLFPEQVVCNHQAFVLLCLFEFPHLPLMLLQNLGLLLLPLCLSPLETPLVLLGLDYGNLELVALPQHDLVYSVDLVLKALHLLVRFLVLILQSLHLITKPLGFLGQQGLLSLEVSYAFGQLICGTPFFTELLLQGLNCFS